MTVPVSLHETMTLPNFYDALAGFDWYYDFSDDDRVYNRGREREAQLQGIAKQSAAHQAIYDAWHQHMFTGQPWGNERAARPERPVA